MKDVEDVEEKTGVMETPRTATTLASDSSSTEISSESETASPPLILASSTISDDLDTLLEDAYVTCMVHGRLDIINTYVCNLQVSPKDVETITDELEHIANLDDDKIKYTFVPIRY